MVFCFIEELLIESSSKRATGYDFITFVRLIFEVNHFFPTHFINEDFYNEYYKKITIIVGKHKLILKNKKKF